MNAIRQKGLGRGLDALLMGDAVDEEGGLRTLPVSALQPGKYQPRTRMDEDSLQQLADSIRAQGIMQPILVRPLAAEGYEIIAGERRWRAAQRAALAEVPVLVRNIPDEAALAMALIENIQRENLNPLEEAQGIQRLINEFAMTHQSAAEAVGRSRSAVTNLLRLLNLAPRVQSMLLDGQIDMGHARALLPLTQVKQIDAAHEIIRKRLSAREAENLAKRLLQPARTRPAEADRDVLALEEQLAEKIGAKVRLAHTGKGRGRLVIEYDSLDQLDQILSGFVSDRVA